MRKSLLGIAIALCGFVFATPALAADYAPPPPAYHPMPIPVPSPCCCPTVRRGLFGSPWSCGGYQSPAYYQPAPVYYPQPYAEPAYYQPGYEPQVGVSVGVRYKSRKHCWRSHGRLVCR